MRLIGQRGPTLSAFVEEWWSLYAEPALVPATLRTYRWVWEQRARSHLGALRLRDVTPLALARFRADREAADAGVETIGNTFTMLGSVFSRAVECQLVDRNPVCAARKPRASTARAAVTAEPEQVEAMRGVARARA